MSTCPCGCGEQKPVAAGGDYPDDWTQFHIYYVPAGENTISGSFEEQAIGMATFEIGTTFEMSCMECGFEWPAHVEETRESKELPNWVFECPHCESGAVVGEENPDYDA